MNNRMSRIKNTIESVSKAVSGTHSELVSRIARLKSHSGTLGKTTKSNADENNLSASLENGKQISDARTQEDCNRGLAARKCTDANESLESMLKNSSGAHQDTPEDSASKTQLFHISYLSTSFGETYNFVADHINWYFSNNSVMDQDKKRNALLQDSKSEVTNKLGSSENTVITEEKTVTSTATVSPETETQDAEKTSTALPISTKKSIANFLSYPSNSVQAFVDSYIGGLVPKLRSETKVAAPEKSKQIEQEGSEKDEEDKAKETKTAEDREKHLSIQREKASLCLLFLHILFLCIGIFYVRMCLYRCIYMYIHIVHIYIHCSSSCFFLAAVTVTYCFVVQSFWSCPDNSPSQKS